MSAEIRRQVRGTYTTPNVITAMQTVAEEMRKDGTVVSVRVNQMRRPIPSGTGEPAKRVLVAFTQPDDYAAFEKRLHEELRTQRAGALDRRALDTQGLSLGLPESERVVFHWDVFPSES